MRQKLFLLTLLLLTSIGGVKAEVLTVYENATGTNSYVPVYGYYADAFLKSEFVIPAEQLSDMDGGTITKMTFYLSSPATSDLDGTFQVFLKEVDENTISTFSGTENATIVYEGTIDATGSTMDIEFTNDYSYDGGNLLVGFYEITESSDYSSTVFTGETVTGASISGYSYSGLDAITPTSRNFIPKTTFEYEPGGAPTCVKPTGLALVGEPTYNSAQLTWTPGEEGQDAWQICINNDEDNLISVTTTTYTLTCTEATAYNVKVRANCGGGDFSSWTSVSFTTPEQFPTPSSLTCTAVTNTTATLSWTENGTASSWEIGFFVDNELDKVEAVTENPCTLINLEEGTEYTVAVRAIYDNDQKSNWSSSTDFMTDFCSDLEKCYITYELKAKAYSGSYQYGWYGSYLLVYDDETDALIDYWTVPSNTGDGTFTGSLPLCPGRTVRFEWYTQYGYDDLLIDGMTVKDANGEEIFSSSGALTNSVKYLVDCTLSEFKKPTNLTASQIGPNSAVLSWTENGEATAWVIDVYNNDDDEEEFVDAATNPFTLTGLNAETEYWVKVRPAGENTKWSEGIYVITTVDCPVPTDVAVTPQATSAEVSWTGFGESFNVRYRKYTEGDVVLSDDFENGIDQWTVVRNGEGTTNTDWRQFKPSNFTSSYFTAHSGDYTAMSRSWASSGYHVDNWLISPQVDLGGKMSYWVLDDGEFHEHYDVYVSTKAPDLDNFDVSIFTMVYEPGDASDEWTQHTVDLSKYAGQKGYVAFRHNDYDQDMLFIDDVVITGPVVNPEEWMPISTTETSIELTDLDSNTKYEVQVQAVKGEETSDWTETTLFTTLDDNPAPTNLAADLVADGATLTWDGTGESYNVQYRTAESAEVLFFENFEQGIPTSWTTIDADGDGNNWIAVSEVPTVYSYYTQVPDWGQNGYNAACSPSYANGAGSFDSDQWLITPLLDLQGTLRFYAASTYSDLDSYEVLLSTSGTAIANFTTTLQAMSTASQNWDEVNIDLSSYAGQQGYIAIHHVSSDKYFLVIDDFGIYDDYTPAGEWQTITVTDTEATLSGLDTNNAYEYQIQSVKGDDMSEWSEIGEFALLSLGNDATDNTSLIVNNYGRQAHVTLAGRTLVKDGYWNTLCLPFDIDDIDESPLADATVKTLFDAAVTGDHVTLTFGEYPIYSGLPYIIKWNEGDDIKNPAFANVIISSTSSYSLDYADGNVKFVGNYDAFPITANDTNIWYMTGENTLKQTANNRTLKSCRAYFDISAEAAGARSIVLDFGDGNVSTSVDSLPAELTGEGEWFSVDGRKLGNAPTRKGVYLNNGKKIVVK